MNDKNIKKQTSAKALDDVSLENVAGGYRVKTGFRDPSFHYLVLSDAERECLSKDLSWMEGLPDASNRTKRRKAMIKAQIACLERHGFTKD